MQRYLTILVMIVLASLSICQAQLAHAGEPSPTTLDEADELTRRGMAAGKAGKWTTAYALLQRAWKLKRAYDIAGNLARAERELGLWDKAASHHYYAKHHMPAFASDKRRAIVNKEFKRAAARVFTLTVTCNVVGASIRIADRERGRTPRTEPVFLLPGEVSIEVHRDGYQGYNKVVEAKAGGRQTLDVQLQKEATASGADARLVGGIATGGVALVGLAVGLAGLVIAGDSQQDAVSLRSGNTQACSGAGGAAHCAELNDAVRAHDSAQDVAIGGFVAGGLLAGASAGLLLWWAIDDEQAASPNNSAMLIPMVNQHGAGLMVTGAW